MLNPANYQFKCIPEKRAGETEEEYQKRIASFLKQNKDNFTQEQIKEWNKEGSITFQLPKDEKAFQAFMQEHPDAQLKMICGDEEAMRQGMRYLKSLGYLNNLTQVELTRDKLLVSGATLEDRKQDLLKYLEGFKPKPNPHFPLKGG